MERHPTQQKILDEAIRIIESSGEASVRVHDIESAVGVTAPSIYHFFGNREGLIVAAQAERILRSFEGFDSISREMLAKVTSKEELRAVFHELMAFVFSPTRALERQRRISILGSAEGRPDLATVVGETSRAFLQSAAENLQVFQDRGWVRADLDLVAFNQWLSGVILGRVYIEIGTEPSPNPAWDSIATSAIEFIVFGPQP